MKAISDKRRGKMSSVVSCGTLKVLKRRRVTWLEKMSDCGRSLVDKE